MEMLHKHVLHNNQEVKNMRTSFHLSKSLWQLEFDALHMFTMNFTVHKYARNKHQNIFCGHNDQMLSRWPNF